ncbi:MAG: LAGLIDADG family homing endonuclease [Candidatus Aenigmatarchaeota archaeon]
MVYEYEYDEQTQKMRVNCLGGIYGDSIEDYSACMATTIDKLMELKKVVRIVFAGIREYEYDFSESKMLLEIALAIEQIMKGRLISIKSTVVTGCEDDAPDRYKFLQRLLNDLRFDPIEAYKNLMREIRKSRIRAERETGIKKTCYNHYMSNALLPIAAILDNCRLIQLAKPQLTEHKDRSLYRKIFHPTIRPNFIYTRYISLPPANSELVERYKVGDTEIEIYSIPGKVRKLYQIVPPEFRLNEFEYTMLDTARRYLGRHEPRESDLEQPERIRENLFRIGLDMLRDLAADHDINEHRLEELASILTRYTAGLGILDLILQDENIQDVEINSPIGSSPIYIFHGIYQECETNIVPSMEDAESWATRFRLRSGRPLDEANPVLDTEIEVPGGRARVAAITRTLSPDGLGFAFRRHRDKPWTLPLFINNKMIDSFSAGLLWFLIDGSRTLLIAGTRSSGKCLSGDTLIALEDGSYAPIRDLKNNQKRVLALNKDGKIVPAKKTYFYKRYVNKILKLKLSSGQEIKLTPEHPLLTQEGWKAADCLPIGSCIAAANVNISKTVGQLSLNSTVFLDKINSVETLEGNFDVYDISVPEYHNFIANRIIVHNSSLLGACMVQIMPKLRIITLEDTIELPSAQLRDLGYNIQSMKSRSVITNVDTELPAEEALRTALRLGDSCLIIGEVRSSIPGWEEVFVVENGETKRVPIEKLENKNIQNYKVPTLGFDLKVGLKPLAGFVKHPKRKNLIEITTRTGRRVTVTPDHSLFHAKDFKIAPIECKDLRKGDSIVIPASIPVGFNDIDNIDVIKMLPEFRLENFEPDTRKAIEKLGWKKATEIAAITSGDIYNYFRTAPNQQINLPISSFENLVREAEIESDLTQLNVVRGTGNSIPASIPVNEDFCRFLGYYVSEGYYSLQEGSGGHVVLTNSNQGMLDDMINLSHNLFDIRPTIRKVYGAGESTQVKLGSCALATLISRLECGRTCTEKRIPSLIFGLGKPKIAAFLRGLFSGDGGFTASIRSGNSIRYASTSKKLVEDVAYLLLAFGIVSTIRYRKPKNERSNVIWTAEFKDREMVEKFMTEIGFARNVPPMIIKAWPHTTANTVKFNKEYLRKHLTKYPRRYRHLFRFERCSKNYLKKVVNDPQCEASEHLKTFANGEFFLDEIKDIIEIELEKPVPVYDLSVDPSQNFIGGFGGILLHNTEALALYEAMRIGALANLVAGTIHGDSAYGVFDRVVNDLGVPPTSFKATDIILIANMLKSPDGLKSFRRCVEMTEVRKHWKIDPMDEGGFVNLLEYSARDDVLKPSKTLLMGESQVLNDIALRVREWKGNWDSVWNNIKLRAKIFQTLVDYSNVNKRPDLLEANNIINSNSHFHIISNDIKEESGTMDSALIYERWLQWLKKNY